ncbi:replication-relaxation family protein [Streptomyces sp. NBC_00667]|uniref:replication-relaxation family protein n=1 Tax=unclassified Streptomyces TaxID=2593676 RepID=UPI003FA6CF50
MPITAAHAARRGLLGKAPAKGTTRKVRAEALWMLRMAQVITEAGSDGRLYVRRAMVELAELGPAETNGKDGKHQIWNLTPAGQKALADGNELPPRPKAGTGAKAGRAGLGVHAVAVTDTILAYTDTDTDTDTVLSGSREYLTDWQVEVNHAIKETGLSLNTDAVLALPTTGPYLVAMPRLCFKRLKHRAGAVPFDDVAVLVDVGVKRRWAAASAASTGSCSLPWVVGNVSRHGSRQGGWLTQRARPLMGAKPRAGLGGRRGPDGDAGVVGQRSRSLPQRRR